MRTFYEHLYFDMKPAYFSPVAGEPIEFPGYEEFQFFIHEAHDFYKRWYDPEDVSYWFDVHEAKTGHLVASGDTKEDAYNKALKLLQTKTIPEIRKAIEKRIRECGPSPLFRGQS